MKKLIMAMLIAVSMVPTISAQDNNHQRMTPQQRTEQRIQKLDEKLSLTDNQKSQIRDLDTRPLRGLLQTEISQGKA